VAELKTDYSPTFQITEGSIGSFSFTVSDTLVNSVVTFTSSFIFDHQAIGPLPALLEFTLNDPAVSFSSSVSLVSSTLYGSEIKLHSATKNKVVIMISKPDLRGATYYSKSSQGTKNNTKPYSVTISGLVLAESV